jgi:16S rRNA (cytidine1402-2'-O)-methyltransferase
MPKSQVFLIPTTLGVLENPSSSIPNSVKENIVNLNHFVVENIRESRRYLASLGLRDKIDASQFIEINKREIEKGIQEASEWLKAGIDIGILSDAGCPGIADPGSDLVRIAHQHNCKVIPLVGPSSILLGLIASGMNGQNFAFHAYLPKEQKQRISKIKELEMESMQLRRTQIFMETPYRNNYLLEDLLKHLDPKTRLCIAASITLPNEYIKTKEVGQWRNMNLPDLNKKPCIFLIQA